VVVLILLITQETAVRKQPWISADTEAVHTGVHVVQVSYIHNFISVTYTCCW
jgi:hypothetical protein